MAEEDFSASAPFAISTPAEQQRMNLLSLSETLLEQNRLTQNRATIPSSAPVSSMSSEPLQQLSSSTTVSSSSSTVSSSSSSSSSSSTTTSSTLQDSPSPSSSPTSVSTPLLSPFRSYTPKKMPPIDPPVGIPSEYFQAPEYGFPLEEHQVEGAQAYFEAVRQFEVERRERWNELVATQDKLNPIEQQGQYMDYIRCHGLPYSQRLHVWRQLSGCDNLREENKDLYASLIRRKRVTGLTTSSSSDGTDAIEENHDAIEAQIELDLARTFPGHPYFEDQRGRESLKNVLMAYSFLDPVIGYCQGMNFVAGAMLLVAAGDEETAFWLFASMLNLTRENFSTSMIGNKASIRVFEQLLVYLLPDLAEHVTSVSATTPVVAMICMPWWLGFYSTTLHLELAFMIWDSFWIFHSLLPMYAAGLAIFELFAAHSISSGQELSSFVGIFREPGWNGFVRGQVADFARIYAKYVDILQSGSPVNLETLYQSAFMLTKEESEKLAVSRELAQLSRRTHFSREQLQALSDRFHKLTQSIDLVDSCQERGITVDVFNQVMSQMFPKWADSGISATHLFSLLDQSGDGVVSFQEMMIGLSILYQGSSDEKLRLVFQLYDTDRSGSIDENELFAIVNFVRKASNLPLIDRQAVKTLFASLDTNKDNAISFDEFKQIVIIFPGLLQFFQIAERPREEKSAWYKKFRKRQRNTLIQNKVFLSNLFQQLPPEQDKKLQKKIQKQQKNEEKRKKKLAKKGQAIDSASSQATAGSSAPSSDLSRVSTPMAQVFHKDQPPTRSPSFPSLGRTRSSTNPSSSSPSSPSSSSSSSSSSSHSVAPPTRSTSENQPLIIKPPPQDPGCQCQCHLL